MHLFFTARFLPLFVTQFLGAFNDNLLKNALVMLITYRLAGEQGNAHLLVTLAAGLFILPFFLFSATAGQVADKYDRATITRIVKIAEIIIMLAAVFGFYAHSVWFLMLALFCMGMHSTFFGPVKYALLPQHLREDELLSGNAYIEAGTFLAILLGTILGGLLILQEGGMAFISCALIGIALLGYLASRFIPPAPPPDPGLTIGRNLWKETWRIVEFSREDRRVFLSILGISWFWLAGATFLAQFPAYAKNLLHGDETVVTLFLTLFSIGIGAGSVLCSTLLKGRITSAYVPAAALGMAIFTGDLYFAGDIAPVEGNLLGAWAFLQGGGWRIAADLLLIAIASGIYIVPLYAIMQHRSVPAHRARIIAANNIMNALFMVASAAGIMLMLALGFTVLHTFLVLAVLNLLAAYVISSLRPAAKKG